MKSMKWFGLVAAVAFPLLSGYAQAPAEGAAQISPDTAEVVKLAGSGVGDEVVLAYIQNSSGTFNLSADNLLYLRDLGVSQPVITAMLNHDNGQRGQAQESPPQQQYAPAPASEAPMPAQAPAPTPAQFSTQPAPPPGQAVTDERNKDEMQRVEEAFKEIFDEAIRLGGTITGEHGIGVSKKSFLPKFAGDAQMRVMSELRRILDPNGILNPGKMFD